MSATGADTSLAQLAAREARRQERPAPPPGKPGTVRAFRVTERGVDISEQGDDASVLREAVWVDLVDPVGEQRRRIGEALGLDIPPPETVASSGEKRGMPGDGDALVVRALVLGRNRGKTIRLVPVTFILFAGRLLTVRLGDARPFHSFVARLREDAGVLASGEAALVGLLELIVGRAAQRLQLVDDELEALSIDVFDEDGRPAGAPARNGRDLRQAIRTVGYNGYLVTRVRQSLHSLRRAIPYLHPALSAGPDRALDDRLRALETDIATLLDHDAHIMSNATFLLDATLGLIDIQQSAIIKIFSVAAVILMPPTLIASIYGMNFKHMPELTWLFGYPYALGLMIASAIVPYLFFRRRGWL